MSNLIRLVYVSRSSFEAAKDFSGIEPTVARILMQSRKNNPKQKIGGVLYYGNGFFFQCLEGYSDTVNALTSKIMKDDRHVDVQILKVNQIEDRLFKNWSMKYIPLEKDVVNVLKRHQVKEFNPYEFNDELIDEFVSLFAKVSDPSEQADQDYSDKPIKKSWWEKFTGLFR